MKERKAEEMAEKSTNDTEDKKNEELSMVILYVFEG